MISVKILGVFTGFVLLLFSILPHPVDANKILVRGNYFFNVYGDGVYDLQKAAHYYEAALRIDPTVPDAWHQLARIDFLNGDFDEALVKINKQLELHGDSFMASYYIRGLIYGFMKEYDHAESDFKTFLTWDPKNWAALNDLAWVYFSQGRYTETADVAASGLSFAPTNPWLLTMRGVALLNMGQTDEARALLQEAQQQARQLTTRVWSYAYPGNDPRLAGEGVEQMRAVIAANLALVGNR